MTTDHWSTLKGLNPSSHKHQRRQDRQDRFFITQFFQSSVLHHPVTDKEESISEGTTSSTCCICSQSQLPSQKIHQNVTLRLSTIPYHSQYLILPREILASVFWRFLKNLSCNHKKKHTRKRDLKIMWNQHWKIQLALWWNDVFLMINKNAHFVSANIRPAGWFWFQLAVERHLSSRIQST
jgi:hypothetical protein